MRHNTPVTTGTLAQPTGSILLHCPIRGPLKAEALAKDGLTPTEEARRIDFLEFLIDHGYPKAHMAVETVVVRGLGESGRNKVRADVVIYGRPVLALSRMPPAERLQHAVLVAEIKRDSASQRKAVNFQLEPAMLVLPSMDVLGAYWDGINEILLVKQLVKHVSGSTHVVIHRDTLANLPLWGQKYKSRPLTVDRLLEPEDFANTLLNIANVMRSHGVNDQQQRYRETVKLLLARYVDERAAAAARRQGRLGDLAIQVYEGSDPGFWERVKVIYEVSARRYGNAASLFTPVATSELAEPTLRDVVRSVQHVNFSSASNDAMQQVFMSFVPAVFKKDLDQFFTPSSLIETMVDMVEIGPDDTVIDPAMGTADFLTASLARMRADDDQQAHQRIRGCDRDPSAYDLAIINMILNHDGQSQLELKDSIQDHATWSEELDVALCNPPFGSRTVEQRADTLRNYDLGHVWEQGENGRWVKTQTLLPQQQLGILFIERCWKALVVGGRMGIILPEGYLCTATYGYVRQWILEHFQLLSLVELPRRIFLKSDADLRSNIMVAKKITHRRIDTIPNYAIHADIVRRVGYKLGKGFTVIPERDPESGLELRDADNNLILASDFTRVRDGFKAVRKSARNRVPNSWAGATLSDIRDHESLDMKPRRLVPRALANRRNLLGSKHVTLHDIAEVLEDTVDITIEGTYQGFCRLVEGQDIRAVEGIVIPQAPERTWHVADRKSKDAFPLQQWDIVIGLVRPERRNIGVLLHEGSDIVAAPDGVAIIRLRPEAINKYPVGWLLSALRSETSRLQLWTESGGTSYGKLSRDQIRNLILAEPTPAHIAASNSVVLNWAKHLSSALMLWEQVGSPEDRRVIVNSAVYGLDED